MCFWTSKTTQNSIRLPNIKSFIQHLLVNLFMHFKVSKVVAIIFKNCFFAFCDTPRDKHHLKF